MQSFGFHPFHFSGVVLCFTALSWSKQGLSSLSTSDIHIAIIISFSSRAKPERRFNFVPDGVYFFFFVPEAYQS